MLELRFLYVGLRKSIEDIFKLVGKKNWSEKNPDILNCLINRHPEYAPNAPAFAMKKSKLIKW